VKNSSDGSETMVLNKYPLDYGIISASTNDPSASALKVLADRNVLQVVERIASRQNPGYTPVVVSADFFQFKIVGESVVPASQMKLESSVPLTSFDGAYIGADGSLMKDAAYKDQVIFDSYDLDKKNLTQYHIPKDVTVSLIWGYNGNYPIAQVENASLGQVFYTSFEEVTDDFSSTARTGEKSLAIPFTVHLPSAGGKYRLTYWMKDGSAPWTFVEDELSADRRIGGAGILIDEVRVRPSTSKMTTSTYNPLVGLTSRTDDNDMTTYYIYDELNRLSVIRDSQNNILKTFEYHYKAKD
jgi:hypothetical protein